MTLLDEASAYEADAAAPATEAADLLTQITKTARELRDMNELVALRDKELKVAQSRVRVLEELLLPELMDKAGQKMLVTVDDYELKRTEVLRASIPPAHLQEAVAWLRANDQGAIVKRQLTLSFGKGEDQRAAEAMDALREHNLAPEDRLSVHPQTLGATVRELLAEGRNVPMDILGVFIQAKVVMKKVKT